MRMLEELAREAIDIQDACNLSGLVHGWSRSITELRHALEEMGRFGTEEVNRHPINVLWIDKLASLAGIQHVRELVPLSAAYDEVRKLAKIE